MKRILILLILILLAGLAALYLTGNLPQLENIFLKPTEQSSGDDPDCGYNWATQPLPELSADLQKKAIKLGIRASEVSAAAYGENCILADGTIDHFAAMQTDLYFKVQVDNLDDRDTLGAIAEEIIGFVEDIPQNSLQGPNSGYIQINYTSYHGDMQSLWFRLADAQTALQNGLVGADLFKELENK